MNRDWSVAVEKAANAIVEGLAFDVIKQFYAAQGLKVNRIDYNSALDLTGKQKYDLIDTFGKKWEVKSDKKYWQTGNVFLEHQENPDFDYLIFFAFRPYIFTKEQYLAIITDPQYPVKSSHEATNKGSILTISQLEDTQN